MIKRLFIIFILPLMLSSCVKKDDINVNVDSAPSFELKSVTSKSVLVDVAIDMTNKSRRNFILEDVVVDVLNGESRKRIATLTIYKPVTLAKRSSGQVKIPIRIEFKSSILGMAQLALLSKNQSNFFFNIKGKLKSGVMSKDIVLEDISLERLLKIMNIDPKEFSLEGLLN